MQTEHYHRGRVIAAYAPGEANECIVWLDRTVWDCSDWSRESLRGHVDALADWLESE